MTKTRSDYNGPLPDDRGEGSFFLRRERKAPANLKPRGH